jgi:hypothetical protein
MIPAMPIPVDCPACSTRLRAPDGAAGMTLSCPRCQAPVPVPGSPAPVRPAPVLSQAAQERRPSPPPPPPRSPARPATPERQPRSQAPRRNDPAGNGCLTLLAWLFALIALAGIVWLLVVRPPA